MIEPPNLNHPSLEKSAPRQRLACRTEQMVKTEHSHGQTIQTPMSEGREARNLDLSRSNRKESMVHQDGWTKDYLPRLTIHPHTLQQMTSKVIMGT